MYATRRRPERDTYGDLVALVAEEKLGRPLLPWQRYVVDVAWEIDPVTGLFAYDVVGATVPRQSGKTSGLLFSVLVARCTAMADVLGQRQMVVYTAQDGGSAQRKMENEFLEILAAAPGYQINQDYTARVGNNTPRIFFTKTRSQLRPSPTESSSGHGDVLDMPALDEIFEHKTMDVDQGFTPPMVTRAMAQKWMVSTAGKWSSVYLKAKREAGRAAVAADTGYGMCWFEWAADPEWDLTDRRLWWLWMPALGHTQTEAKVASQLADLGPREFRRAFGNIDDDGDAEEVSPIDPEMWGRQQDEGAVMVGRLCYGVASSMDRSQTTIAVAGSRDGGGWLIEHIETRAGTMWAVGRLATLMTSHSGSTAVAIDPGSPAGVLVPELETAGLPLIKMAPRDQMQAAGQVVQHLTDGDLYHLGDEWIDEAVLGARSKDLGDAWVWDRRRSTVYVGPLEAGTLAFGGLFRLPDEPEDNTSVYEDRGFVEW